MTTHNQTLLSFFQEAGFSYSEIVSDQAQGHGIARIQDEPCTSYARGQLDAKKAAHSAPLLTARKYRRTRDGQFVQVPSNLPIVVSQRPAFASKAKFTTSPAKPRRCSSDESSTNNLKATDAYIHSHHKIKTTQYAPLNPIFLPTPMPTLQNVLKPERQVSLDLESKKECLLDGGDYLLGLDETSESDDENDTTAEMLSCWLLRNFENLSIHPEKQENLIQKG